MAGLGFLVLFAGCAGGPWRSDWEIHGLPGKVTRIAVADEDPKGALVVTESAGSRFDVLRVLSTGALSGAPIVRGEGALAAAFLPPSVDAPLLITTTGDVYGVDGTRTPGGLPRVLDATVFAGRTLLAYDHAVLELETSRRASLPDSGGKGAGACFSAAVGANSLLLLRGSRVFRVELDPAPVVRALLDLDPKAGAGNRAVLAAGDAMVWAPPRAGEFVLSSMAGGRVAWEARLGQEPRSVLVGTGELPVVARTDERIVAYDRSTGEMRWQSAMRSRLAAWLPGRTLPALLCVTQDRIVFLDSLTGRTLERFDLPETLGDAAGEIRSGAVFRFRPAPGSPFETGLLLGAEEWAEISGDDARRLSGALYFMNITARE